MTTVPIATTPARSAPDARGWFSAFGNPRTYLHEMTTVRAARIGGVIAVANNVPEFFSIATRDGYGPGAILSNVFSKRMLAESIATLAEWGGGMAGFGLGGFGGSMIGGFTGGVAGSVVPGVGNAAGALVGGAMGGLAGCLTGAYVVSPLARGVGADIAEFLTGVRPSASARSVIGLGVKGTRDLIKGPQIDMKQAMADGAGFMLPEDAVSANSTIKLDVLQKAFAEAKHSTYPTTQSPGYADFRRLTEEVGITFGDKFGYNEFKPVYDRVQQDLNSNDPARTRIALQTLIEKSAEPYDTKPGDLSFSHGEADKKTSAAPAATREVKSYAALNEVPAAPAPAAAIRVETPAQAPAVNHVSAAVAPKSGGPGIMP